MTKRKTVPRNSNQYEYLASTYFVKGSALLDDASKNSHKLYNASLYQLRQALFKHKGWLSYQDLNRMFKLKYDHRENMLYHSFPYVQSAQQTIKEATHIWKAWLQALKAYKANPAKFSCRPRLPKYLKINASRHVFYVTNQNAKVKKGYLIIPKLNFKLKLKPGIEKIQRVIFKPASGGYKVIVPYKTNKGIDYLPDNGNYIGIDPGIDNAFACVSSNGEKPLLVNGRALKAANQYYNKARSRLKTLQAKYHQLESVINTKQGSKPVYQETRAMKNLTEWRNRKIEQFAHKASKRIIEYALSCEANTIVIGKNKNWKRSSNMGKRNNQNFIGIPHNRMIELIRYKANLAGITVIATNESYTSQTSFLDKEKPCWNNGNKSRKKQGISPSNRRIHRGLFKSNNGTLINADVNGAYQIIKKVFPNASFAEGIAGLVLSPVKWSPLI